MRNGKRCCTSLNGRVFWRSPSGLWNLLSICLVHLFVGSTRTILGPQCTINWNVVPGVDDACKYLWSSERIRSLPAWSVDVTVAHRVQWLTMCRGIVLIFPAFFPLDREVFWVFCITLLIVLLFIFPVFPRTRLQFVERAGYWELRIFGDEYLWRGS